MAIWNFKTPKFVYDLSELNKIEDDFEAIRLAMLSGLQIECVNRMKKMNKEKLKDILSQKYTVEGEELMTFLIESTLHNQHHVVDMLIFLFHADPNDTGNVLQFGTLVEGATALWCAAARGFVGIVDILSRDGAIVDSYTSTKSTPLRAACFAGELITVERLVMHKANINTTNIYNSTCLMIASYNGHTNIVKFLINNGATIDAQTYCGSTAMHFAAQANELEVVKLLISSGAKQLENDRSMTPILVAAERTNDTIVYYLIDKIKMTQQNQIDVFELLGASYLNDKDDYNFELGFTSLLKAMKMRCTQHSTYKQPYKKVAAYNNQIECVTVHELLRLRNIPEALHYESLIIRERILGENNPDLLPSIIYRGACYADLRNYAPCLKLWYYAVQISRNNNFSVSDDLLRFAQVFCQMIKADVNIELIDLKTVLLIAVDELKMSQSRILAANIGDTERSENKMFGNMLSTLGLIIIISLTLEKECNLENPLRKDLMKIIVEINRMNLKSKEKRTLLHLCLNYRTNVDNIFTTGICCFPNYLSMKLLIFCGADVNAVDNNRNTPLHYIGKFIKDFPHIPHASDQLDTKKMVIELLNADAHTDVVNNSGDCPHAGYLKNLFNFTNNSPKSLKCISACALKYNIPEEYYCNELPQNLLEFTNLH